MCFCNSLLILPLPNISTESSSLILSLIQFAQGTAVGDNATTPMFLSLQSFKFTISTPCERQTIHCKLGYLFRVCFPIFENLTESIFTSGYVSFGFSYAPNTCTFGNLSKTDSTISALSFSNTSLYIYKLFKDFFIIIFYERFIKILFDCFFFLL